MCKEKQLAEIKAEAGKDVQGKVSYAERVMAVRLLVQWRRVHVGVVGPPLGSARGSVCLRRACPSAARSRTRAEYQVAAMGPGSIGRAL